MCKEKAPFSKERFTQRLSPFFCNIVNLTFLKSRRAPRSFVTIVEEGAYECGQQRLQETFGLDDEAIGYTDFAKYGKDCMTADHVLETEFGLRRLDPPFPEQTQEQQML